MNLKVPPYSIEAEQSVLGACFVSTDAARIASRMLTPEDFYFSQHQIIFEAIRYLCERDLPVDIISVSKQLKDEGKLEAAQGITYLAKLADSVPNAVNTKYYAQVVKDAALKRRLFDIGSKISELAFEKENADILLHQAKTILDNVNTEPKIRSVGERSLEILRAIDKMPPQIPLGIETLDSVVKFYRGDLVLIEAERKNGKTTFAMNLILRYLKKGHKVMLATYEIPADTVYIPLMAKAYAGKVPFTKDDKMKQVSDFINDLGGNFYTLPENAKLEDFETSILDFIKENSIDFVFVDYDQLVRTHRKFDTEERRVAAISRTSKQVALEGNCVVFLLSQINKEGNARWSSEKEDFASVVLKLQKDPVLNELKVWIPYNRYNRTITEENAVSLEIDWEKRLLFA